MTPSMRSSPDERGISELAFDLLTLLQQKLQAIDAYSHYRHHAEQTGYHHVADFLTRCEAEDRRAVEELRALVAHQLVVGLEEQRGFPFAEKHTHKGESDRGPARSEEKTSPEPNVVNEASQESFPASDPPAFTVGRKHFTGM